MIGFLIVGSGMGGISSELGDGIDCTEGFFGYGRMGLLDWHSGETGVGIAARGVGGVTLIR